MRSPRQSVVAAGIYFLAKYVGLPSALPLSLPEVQAACNSAIEPLPDDNPAKQYWLNMTPRKWAGVHKLFNETLAENVTDETWLQYLVATLPVAGLLRLADVAKIKANGAIELLRYNPDNNAEPLLIWKSEAADMDTVFKVRLNVMEWVDLDEDDSQWLLNRPADWVEITSLTVEDGDEDLQAAALAMVKADSATVLLPSNDVILFADNVPILYAPQTLDGNVWPSVFQSVQDFAQWRTYEMTTASPQSHIVSRKQLLPATNRESISTWVVRSLLTGHDEQHIPAARHLYAAGKWSGLEPLSIIGEIDPNRAVVYVSNGHAYARMPEFTCDNGGGEMLEQWLEQCFFTAPIDRDFFVQDSDVLAGLLQRGLLFPEMVQHEKADGIVNFLDSAADVLRPRILSEDKIELGLFGDDFADIAAYIVALKSGCSVTKIMATPFGVIERYVNELVNAEPGLTLRHAQTAVFWRRSLPRSKPSDREAFFRLVRDKAARLQLTPEVNPPGVWGKWVKGRLLADPEIANVYVDRRLHEQVIACAAFALATACNFRVDCIRSKTEQVVRRYIVQELESGNVSQDVIAYWDSKNVLQQRDAYAHVVRVASGFKINDPDPRNRRKDS